MHNSAPDLSIVIPVYNAGVYLNECLDSVLLQDLGSHSVEVIAVDDGSTDGSAKLLDEYSLRFPSLTVIHQPNSGWPGSPRNAGLKLAKGRYVFFCDADDYVGHESFRRMVDFADEFESDLVIPKMVGVGGRWIRKSIYRETQVDADLLRASQSSGPTKLFRLDVLRRHDIRFPEGKVLAEDTIFVFKVFTVAKRVSILSDYDYYFARAREDGGNISYKRTDPYDYSRSLAAAASVVKNSLGNRVIESAIILELFRRVGLNKYEGPRFADAGSTRQGQWVEAHQTFLDQFLPVGSEMALRYPQRERMALVREGRVNDLALMSDVKGRAVLKANASHAIRRGQGVELRGSLGAVGRFRRADSMTIELRSRDGDGILRVSSWPGFLSVEAGESRIAPAQEQFNVFVDGYLLEALALGTWDVYVTVMYGAENLTRRMQADEGSKLYSFVKGRRTVRPYRTDKGNLSFRIAEGNALLVRRALSRMRTYVRRLQ